VLEFRGAKKNQAAVETQPALQKVRPPAKVGSHSSMPPVVRVETDHAGLSSLMAQLKQKGGLEEVEVLD
jgi:hypothetical protein